MKNLIVGASMAVLVVSSHALAQSDETCVAYMEADARYEEREREAKEAATEYKRFVANFINSNLDVQELKAALLNMNLSGATEQEKMTLLKMHIDALPEEKRRQWQRADSELKNKQARMIEEAKAEKKAAYMRVYEGPTSEVGAVMNSLLHMDRERCRARHG